ncbi:methyltransferase family protein [Vibrio sonorensis]|uniref:methyltransferase family protein n=1 Tax=Vibrio sonorensis TaxID=1004316 RepID=UPI0008DA9CF0|nr:isoprenylcysteine carboxylmethyltransferase family protein [Vibrio sonorensis]
MKALELKIPPVVVFIVCVVLIHQISDEWLGMHVSLPFAGAVFFACFVISGFVGLAGVYEFRKQQTTVNPIKVETAAKVVDSGIFARTRNPMYLGLALLLLGFAYWQQNIIALTVPILFVFYMNRFQIEPEERALTQLFGDDYLDYQNRVRRWI